MKIDTVNKNRARIKSKTTYSWLNSKQIGQTEVQIKDMPHLIRSKSYQNSEMRSKLKMQKNEMGSEYQNQFMYKMQQKILVTYIKVTIEISTSISYNQKVGGSIIIAYQ